MWGQARRYQQADTARRGWGGFDSEAMQFHRIRKADNGTAFARFQVLSAAAAAAVIVVVVVVVD